MAGIKINTGAVRIEIDRDGIKDEISFNPNDVGLVNRYYKLIEFIDRKQKEYIEKAKMIDNSASDKVKDGLLLLESICIDIKEQIDIVFGAGTSHKVFGDALTLDMFSQFFIGITPYIQGAREDKVKKYIEESQGVM